MALLRATAASGAVQGAVFASAHAYDGPKGSWPGFAEAQRAVVVQAALGALRSG